MLILGCDTSSIASGALLRVPDGPAGPVPPEAVEVLGSFRTCDTRSHAEVMAPGLRDLLDQAGVRGEDLDLVLTGIGPGPFTGLRAGIMTARALAWVWQIPLRGVVSLDAVAQQALADAAAAGHEHFRVATDARRREVYAADYRLHQQDGVLQAQRCAGPVVGPATEVATRLGGAELPVAGRGAALYPEALPGLPGHEQDQPEATALVLAALASAQHSTTETTSPLYLRESDAKVPAARKKAVQ